jgi:hypothetical protein
MKAVSYILFPVYPSLVFMGYLVNAPLPLFAILAVVGVLVFSGAAFGLTAFTTGLVPEMGCGYIGGSWKKFKVRRFWRHACGVITAVYFGTLWLCLLYKALFGKKRGWRYFFAPFFLFGMCTFPFFISIWTLDERGDECWKARIIAASFVYAGLALWIVAGMLSCCVEKSKYDGPSRAKIALRF